MTPARALLDWYRARRRPLPWRADRDPYRVWVSEVMLQQTRADVAAPYFEAFVARFPTVEALAAAPLEAVLARWSGLGYYRRASNLHAAARRVAAAGGGLPRDLAGLAALPGIGAYTAAAVASIAFGVAEPVVDGNVERVAARLEALDADPKTAAGRRAVEAVARALLDPDHPGDSNQALMELGATVCTPRRPRCGDCPLAPGCAARAAGDPERWPPPRRRRAVERHRRVVAVVELDGRVLLFRRPEDEKLLAGTWELPWWEPPEEGAAAGAGAGVGPGGPEARGAAAAAALAGRYGGRWTLEPPPVRVRHGITHRAFEIDVYRGRLAGGDGVAEGPEAGWFDAAGRAALPLSSLVGKALAAVSRPAARSARRRGRRPG